MNYYIRNSLNKTLIVLLVSSLIGLGVANVYATTPVVRLVLCDSDPELCPDSQSAISIPIIPNTDVTMQWQTCPDKSFEIYQVSNSTWICAKAIVNA